ncbi:MAG TPA: fumarylacetoacetate hydrolase family protein [Clostridia bacterium]|nr:fumarylacetoacetate hydrolase family protein [Clostridia bacterium]
MKLLNYKEGKQIYLGIKSEHGIIPVKYSDANSVMPTTMEQVIASGESGLRALELLTKNAASALPEENLVYAPCVTNPEKLLCVGVNYIEHSNECNFGLPSHPILFSKFNNALAAHNQAILLPGTAEKYDYEAELVVIIGKEASNVSKDEALSYVFGYSIGNDMSARDLQFRTRQWLLGKTCDHFAPVGPYIVTADEIDPNHLDIECTVNGEVRQHSNTSRMIFNCAAIISYVSQYMTLKPGDIIFTGTPSGVILGRPEAEQKWLKPGDIVSVSIENLGTLVNIMK